MTTLLPAPILCLPAPLRLAEPPRYRIEWREDYAKSRLVRFIDGERTERVTDWDYPGVAVRVLSQVRGH